MKRADARNLRPGDEVQIKEAPLGWLDAVVIGQPWEDGRSVVIPVKVPGYYEQIEVLNNEIR
jgi:hypothetical protein